MWSASFPPFHLPPLPSRGSRSQVRHLTAACTCPPSWDWLSRQEPDGEGEGWSRPRSTASDHTQAQSRHCLLAPPSLSDLKPTPHPKLGLPTQPFSSHSSWVSMTTLCMIMDLLKPGEKPPGNKAPLPKSGVWVPRRLLSQWGLGFLSWGRGGEVGQAAPPEGFEGCLGQVPQRCGGVCWP